MNVFKFGGASVKDASAIQNLAEIVKVYSNEPLLVVISAMGKSTNALEEILNAGVNKEPFDKLLAHLLNYHLGIVDELFRNEKEEISRIIHTLFAGVAKELASVERFENFNRNV